MSEIQIIPVSSKKEMSQFIEFNYELYKGNEYAVPDLATDIRDTFNPMENPGLEFSEVQLFIAKKNGKVVGRVAAIINNKANSIWNMKNVRFGWIDFIDDIEVSKALLDAVSEWGKQRGMTNIQGPLGITDMDPEGMLIDGFDRLGTMSTIYNYPYYPQHLEKLGFEKEADWIEMNVKVPDAVPEKMATISNIVKKRYGVHVKKMDGRKDLFDRGYGQKIFECINKAYKQLFGYSELSQKQIDKLVARYVPLLNWDMVTLIEKDDSNDIVGVGISIPSLCRALQKAQGHLTPFGWYHLLKSLKWKYEDGVELLLIAVDPEWQGRGLNAILFDDLIPIYQKMGFKWAETNPQLETNTKGQAQWAYLDSTIVKRRRCFKKEL